MGEVFKCHDLTLMRDVAIKFLSSDATGEAIARFQREAQVLGRLKHANILDVHDFGRSPDGRLFFIMSYLDGFSLAGYLRDHYPLRLEETLSILDQVCAGLENAHNRDILHRDIKPSNVMLVHTDQGRLQVKLIDFGIAKLTQTAEQSMTQKGVAIGTPTYMPPEMVRGEQADVRSDVYSFGVLMFELFTGRLPFIRDTGLETMLMHLNEPVPKLSDSCTGLPQPLVEELERIVSRCMAKNREDRFNSMSEVRTALSKIEPPPNLANAGEELASRAVRQKTKGSFGLLLAFGSIVIVSIGFAVFKQHSNTQSETVPILSKEPLEAEPQRPIPSEEDLDTRSKGSTLTLYREDNHDRVEGNLLTDDEDLEAGSKRYSWVPRWELRKSTSFTAAGLRHLAKLKITSLALGHTATDADALKVLAQIDTLKSLEITSCNELNNEDLAVLSGKKLSKLTLSGSKLNGDVCRYVAKIPDLEYFTLEKIQLTPNQLHSLLKLKDLRRLGFSGMTITSALSKELARLPIDQLDLKYCPIESGAFNNLRSSSIRMLYVECEQHLAYKPEEFKRLQLLNQLELRGIKKADALAIKRLLPNCRIGAKFPQKKLDPFDNL